MTQPAPQQPQALAVPYDPDAVIQDQAILIGQLQTQLIMRNSALRTLQAEVARLSELVPAEEPKPAKRQPRRPSSSGE